MISFYVGLTLCATSLAAIIIWRWRLSRISPEQYLQRLRVLSEVAARAIKDIGPVPPVENPVLLTWSDVAAMYSNSRTVVLPMARRLSEISPKDSEVEYTRIALMQRHRRLRRFLLIHTFELLVDKLGAGAEYAHALRAYSKPAIWAYCEEIVILENLLEAASAPRHLIDALEEIL